MSLKRRETPFPVSKGGMLLRDEPLAPITSFRIGGPAQYLLIPGSVEDIRAAITWAETAGLPWRALGNGTNILIPDAGLPGLTIRLWHVLNRIEISGTVVEAEAGADMLTVAMQAGRAGLSGLEWGSGIPGTVGGAVYMNAGVAGADLSQLLVDARVLQKSGKVETLPAAELGLAYRTSILQSTGGLVLSARFQLQPGTEDEIFERMNAHLSTRRSSQPIDKPNCGSVFRNPPGDYAGRLIEACGLKGHTHGGVAVSEQHANFIVNTGEGTAEDVVALVHHIQTEVKQRFDVSLELELRVLT